MKNTLIKRQGDMMLYKVPAEAVKGKFAKNVNKVVIGLGEVTGHSHIILPVDTTELVQYFDKESDLEIDADSAAIMDRLFFEVKNELGLTVHEEHNPIKLEPGFYLRINQQQFDPWENVMKRVND